MCVELFSVSLEGHPLSPGTRTLRANYAFPSKHTTNANDLPVYSKQAYLFIMSNSVLIQSTEINRTVSQVNADMYERKNWPLALKIDVPCFGEEFRKIRNWSLPVPETRILCPRSDECRSKQRFTFWDLLYHIFYSHSEYLVQRKCPQPGCVELIQDDGLAHITSHVHWVTLRDTGRTCNICQVVCLDSRQHAKSHGHITTMALGILLGLVSFESNSYNMSYAGSVSKIWVQALDRETERKIPPCTPCERIGNTCSQDWPTCECYLQNFRFQC